MRAAFLTLSVAALVLLTAPAAYAPVVPKTCGTVGARGNSYTVKAHVVACASARAMARAYLGRGSRPRGYSCRKFPRRVTRIRFRCTRGQRFVFAVER